MATPIPGQEAIDNGNGTATTRYSDGSEVVWDITSGAHVASTPPGGGGTLSAFTNPTTLAGTAGTAPNTTQGYTNWGMTPVNIQNQYLPYLQTAPGYLPGSGSYNQFNLSQPGLVGTVGGVPNQNLRYGQGGAGDPTTGREPQTPQEWLNGPKAFSWEGNMGQTAATQGLDYIANLFGRPDAGSSGISTAAWSAPDAYWKGLAQAVQSGMVKASAFGLQALASKGYTVNPPGGAVDLGGGGAAGGGTGTLSASGAGGGDAALQDYYATITANAQAMQAAQLAYQDWYMRTQDDEQAFQHAQQTYENKWQESMFEYKKQQDQWNLQQSAGYFDVNGVRTPTLQGIAQDASLTGMYQGKPTFQREQYETGVTQNLLGLQAGLRGPENYAQYLKVLGSTPQGMRDVVNAAAGRFQMPSTSGMTPGQGTNAADVQSLLRDVQTGAPQAQSDWTNALSGGLPAPNQISLQNYSKFSPTQRSMLLSAYEGAGWDPKDVQDMIQKSSPLGAVGGGGTTGAFRF